MPEHLRALVVVLVLSGLVFVCFRPSTGELAGYRQFTLWRKLWLLATVAAFAANSFWIYAACLALLLLPRRHGQPAQLATSFLLLLFVVPAAGIAVSGLGLINHLVTLNHLRLLSLLLLLPAAFQLAHNRETTPLGKSWADRLFVAYLLLVVVLQLRDNSLTNTLRIGFYTFIDAFLPYYVLSRALRTQSDIKHAMTAFALAGLLLAVAALFETLRHWNLYTALVQALDLQWGFKGYLDRAGMQRAAASTGQPIPLGYVMMAAMGMYACTTKEQKFPWRRRAGYVLLTGGLVATLSRGPWMGAIAMVATYLLLGPKPLQSMFKLVLAGSVALLALAVLPIPGGSKALDLLPFIGQTDVGSITYRDDLLTNALIVIERNLWFGSVDYLQTPEMLRMIQGEGIIDLVNTYIQVALETGIVGLMLFVASFVVAGLAALKRCRRAANAYPELNRQGRWLLALLAGTAVTIFTTSSITVIPYVYWSILGMAVAYAYGETPSNTSNSVEAGGKP